MNSKMSLLMLLAAALSWNLAGCGAVFVNQGSANYSLNDGVKNPAVKKSAAKKSGLGSALCVWVDDEVANTYPYNGANGSITEETANSGKASLKCVLNGSDYSGVIVDPGKNCDLQKARDDGYVLSFCAKGEKGNEPIMVGFTDSGEDGKEVEIGIPVSGYKKLTTEWQKVEIPLKDFASVGGFWDGSKVNDGVPVDWKTIHNFRVKDNKSGKGMYTVYVDEVGITPPGK